MTDMEMLLEAGPEVLEPYRKRDTLVALDYDGTLAPIVANRNRAVMRDRTRLLLERVAQQYPTVLITGRSRQDAERFVTGIGLQTVIGNHGLDLDEASSAAYELLVQGWKAELSERLESYGGFVIEDKRLSLSIHYRNAPDKDSTRAAIWRIAGDLENARRVAGKEVINLVPVDGSTKADAVLRTCRRYSCARALFVGDDATDEDVFKLRSGGILGIRVGTDTKTHAAYALRDQSEIDQLLEALLNELPS